MGKGYVYRCPKCGHEEELLSGVGFMSLVEADVERESILAGIYGPKAQAALVAHPEAHVSVERAMYQCRGLRQAGRPSGGYYEGPCPSSNPSAV